MTPQQKLKLKNKFSQYGGVTWEILVDVYDDKDFFTSLNSQEKQVLNQLPTSLGSIHGYENVLSGVLFKYLAWLGYKGGKIPEIKEQVESLESKIKENQSSLDAIEKSAKYIGGAEILVEYSKSFKTSAENHSGQADKNKKHYFISLLAFGVVAIAIFTISISDVSYIKNLIADDVNSLPYNIGFFSLKAALLIFTYQITQFFRKNYNAEKHLEEVYQHRSDVLQSLHAVYNSITDTVERDQILKAGALFAYERGETGYITTKEGAGSGDDLVASIFTKLAR